MHVFNLAVVIFQLPDNEFLVLASPESFLDLRELVGDVRQLLDVSLRVLSPVQQSLCFLLQHLDLCFENTDLAFKVTFVELVDVKNVMIFVFSDRASEADPARAVLAKAFHVFEAVIIAAE